MKQYNIVIQNIFLLWKYSLIHLYKKLSMILEILKII